MHHLADDRPGTDERDLDDQIVEMIRPEPGQRRHLRARLDLEDPDRVGRLQHPVDIGIIRRQMRQIEACARRPTIRVNVLTIPVDERDRVLQDGHHAEAQQIDLDDPHGGTVVLVPLDHDAPGHAGVLERHHLVEPSPADHHAAGMLPQVARQVLHPAPERAECLDPRIGGVAPRIAEMPGQRVFGIGPLEPAHQLGQPVDPIGVEPQRLANLPGGATVAIGDDVRGHRRAQLPVALVDVLDDRLAPVATRQVEIDVGPLPAFFREKPLEQQIHADRIDRRDPQAVADRAVGRRAAALHQNPLPPAEVDEVPDDEEIAGQVELLDEIQFARDLAPSPLVVRPIALARANLRDLPEERRHRLVRWHGIVRKAIAEIGHRVLQPFGQRFGGLERLGKIVEQPGHLTGRLQIPFGVARQPPTRTIDRRLVTHTGQDIVERAIRRRGEPYAVGRQERHAIGRRESRQRLRVGFLIPEEMPLHLDVDVARTEQAKEPIEHPADPVPPAVERRPAGERDESARRAIEILERECTFALRRPQFHPGHEAAQVAIPFRRLDEHRQPPETRRPPPSACPVRRLPRRDRQFAPDDRRDPGRRRRLMKPRRAVDSVAIEQRERWIVERGRTVDERLGRRRPVEERERRRGMQLDVHQSSTPATNHPPSARSR